MQQNKPYVHGVIRVRAKCQSRVVVSCDRERSHKVGGDAGREGPSAVFSNRKQNDPRQLKWGPLEDRLNTSRRTHVNRVRVDFVGDIAVVVIVVVVVITAAAVVIHQSTSLHGAQTNASDPLPFVLRRPNTRPVVTTILAIACRRRYANENQTGC